MPQLSLLRYTLIMTQNKAKWLYIIFDFFAAVLSWAIFYSFRKVFIEPKIFGYKIPIETGTAFYLAILLVPFFWIFIHYLSGYYRNSYRKSDLGELGKTFLVVLLGSTILFFALVLDDWVKDYQSYYTSALVLFSTTFTLTYIPRLLITKKIKSQIRSGKIHYRTLIIGSNEKAEVLYNDIVEERDQLGHNFMGFINIREKEKYRLSKYMPHLGNIHNLRAIVEDIKPNEIIIAIERNEHKEINNILNPIYGLPVEIKAIPDMYDILTGKVKMTTLFGTPLIQLSSDLMPLWQQSFKEFIDISASVFAIILLSPLALFIAIGIKSTSKGPVIYSHQRIGKYGRPFTLYKFRSMHVDAEKGGPKLSSKNDSRLTSFGKFLRRTKLDELPNFFNVVKGDMSLVGPRPERQYYIDKIVKVAPQYVLLQKVKPGITSWGQVKYGYAENVDQMVRRLRYDLIYLQNMSLYIDMKILWYTLKTVFKGNGI